MAKPLPQVRRSQKNSYYIDAWAGWPFFFENSQVNEAWFGFSSRETKAANGFEEPAQQMDSSTGKHRNVHFF